MKSWKKLWKEELDSALPKNSPIAQETSQPIHKFSKKKKIWTFSALGVALTLVISFAFIFSVISTPTVPSLLLVEINPSATFILDEDGKVERISSNNFDADVILSSQERMEEMLGKSAEESIKIFINYAIELGYMDTTGDSMTISSCDGDVKKIEKSITEYLDTKGNNLILTVKNVNVDEVVDKLGVKDVKDVKDAVGKIRNLPELYSDKSAIGKTTEQMKAEYANAVEDYVNKIIDDKIQEIDDPILREIIKNAQSSGEILEIIEVVAPELLPQDVKDLVGQIDHVTKEDYPQKMKELSSKVYDDLNHRFGGGEKPGHSPSHGGK